jgi:hypothetical protein
MPPTQAASEDYLPLARNTQPPHETALYCANQGPWYSASLRRGSPHVSLPFRDFQSYRHLIIQRLGHGLARLTKVLAMFLAMLRSLLQQ